MGKPTNLSNSEWLRSRAEECRAMAKTFKDQEARERMMRVAREYALLARVTEEHESQTRGQALIDVRSLNA
jgi:hypothetical protein